MPLARHKAEVTGQQVPLGQLVAKNVDGYRSQIWFIAYGETAPDDDRFCTGFPRQRATLTARWGQMAWVRGNFIGPEGPGPLRAPVRRRVL